MPVARLGGGFLGFLAGKKKQLERAMLRSICVAAENMNCPAMPTLVFERHACMKTVVTLFLL